MIRLAALGCYTQIIEECQAELVLLYWDHKGSKRVSLLSIAGPTWKKPNLKKSI